MPKRRMILCLLLLAVLGFAVYGLVVNGELLWDDQHLVQDNFYVTSWAHVGRIFTSPIGGGSGVRYTFYRPLQMLSYLIDHSLWGAGPRGYHLTNIMLHVLTAWAMLWVVLTLSGRPVAAFLSAAFFVVHPIHTEAVCYISGRADSLSALFLLLAFVAYVHYVASKRPWALAGTLAAFILAVLCKESSLIFPALILVYSAAYRRPVAWRAFLGVLALAAVYALLRVTLLSGWIVYEGGQGNLWQRIPGALVALAEYARLLLLPFPLHMEYGYRLFRMGDPRALAGLALLVLVALALWRWRRGDIAFGLLWFLVLLLPVSNLYLINAYMAEHWLYLPSVGLFMVLGLALSRLLDGPVRRRAVTLAAASLMIVFYAALTLRQCRIWSDAERLYEHTLAFAPDSLALHINLGLVLQAKGRSPEALAYLEKARDMAPDHYRPYIGLGRFYVAERNIELAAAAYEKALALNPGLGIAHNNLAVICFFTGRRDQALTHAAAAQRLGCPLHPDFLRQLESHREETP